ncbi:neurofilament medium polypeptide isoform X2 [Drosophila suzukii]|uniref:Neurofilament medium polypeptide isoform X2 n=1 Tax=Drosophila suzukii TaxID=28584 RepID=A0AB39Z3W8_DROSZ
MAIRMQDCRSMSEPCQCPRCRFEMRMSSHLMNCQEKCTPSAKCCNMGGLPQENQPSFDNCQRPCWPKRSVPQEVSQNFHQGNSQKLPQESPLKWNCQPLRNIIYGQQSPGQANQEYRQQNPQQTTQQFSQQSPRKCCYQVPPQNFCQQSPQNYFQTPPGILFHKHPGNVCQEDFEDDHYNGQNGMRRRPCYCVTHEMGVQTDETECKSTKDQSQSPTPEEPKDPSVEYIAVTEFTTKEVEVKHHTGAKDIYIERVQSVSHFPTTAREHITETPTRKKVQEEKHENNTIKDESKEDNIVPLRALRPSELEPIMESAKAEVPKVDSKAETGELLYYQYETFERDFGDSQETVKKSTKKGRSALGSPAPRLSKTRTPTPRSPISRSPTSRSPGTRSPISLTPSRGSPTSHKSIYRTPREDMSRSESGRDISPPLSPQSSATKSEQNTSIGNDDDTSSDNSDDKDEEIKPEVPEEEERLPSDYDNVSTVHVRVTNRKEASVKRPNGEKSNDKITAVFESRVSEVLLKEQGEKKPGEKKPSKKNEGERQPGEKKPEEKKPSANKPEKKKSKGLPPPKMEMKRGYPSNDLVCRFANPPKCKPTCRSFRFPCPSSNPFKSFNSFNSFNSFKQCPSRSPSTRQYDPIYGFGSKCIAYYCR